jgi:hypothetical protein
MLGLKTEWILMTNPLAKDPAMIHDRLWAGLGLGTWSAAYPAYASYDDGTFVNQAHNDWLQWGAEGGLPFPSVAASGGGADSPPRYPLDLGHWIDRGVPPRPVGLPDAAAPRAGGILLRASRNLGRIREFTYISRADYK